MALQEGFFYKTCAMYPLEVSEESACKSMVALIDSPVHGEPIRVTEETTMWSIPGVKVGKPHSCYLARFDPATSIGVIFLGTHSPSYSHRSVRVHGGVEHDESTMLTTTPPAAFNEVFYLNLSHPLHVKLLYVVPPTNLNSLRRSRFGLSTAVGPPPVGITEFQNMVPRLLVSLDAVSVDTFWQLHKAYHIARPTRRTSLGLEGGAASSGGRGRGATPDRDGESTPNRGGKRAAPDGGGEVVSGSGRTAPGWGSTLAGTIEVGGDGGGGALVGGGSVDGRGPGKSTSEEATITEDAPWGRIGKLRIGIDICCIVDDASDDANDDASDDERVALEENAFILDGTVVVSDFFFGIDNMIAM